jgi:hypothetical protein
MRATEGDAGRVARRRAFAMSYYDSTLKLIDRWANARSEEDNFPYALTAKSRNHLAHLLTCLFGGSPALYRSYFQEIEDDGNFRRHVETILRSALGMVVASLFLASGLSASLPTFLILTHSSLTFARSWRSSGLRVITASQGSLPKPARWNSLAALQARRVHRHALTI